MQLIDTHCHIDLYPDYLGVIDECERHRITTIAVTNAPSVFQQCQQLLDGKRYLRTAIGLHPELAHLRSSELPLFAEYLAETRFVGEIGLDFVTSDDQIRNAQRRVFETILTECARYRDRLLSVHSRRAAAEVVDMVGSGFAGTVILHWYSGSLKVAHRAIERGMYFSVNTAMMRSEVGRKLVATLPRDRLLTESDGPFVQTHDRAARPYEVHTTVSEIAYIWETADAEAAKTIHDNFNRLLKADRTNQL